jgi:serine protein kinase
MAEIERLLDVGESGVKREDFRREVISKVGAWSLDHQGKRPDYEQIFPRPIAELREAFFHDRKKQVRKINEDLLVFLVDGPSKMAADAALASRTTMDTLKGRFGYCENCAKDAVLALVRKRYA